MTYQTPKDIDSRHVAVIGAGTLGRRIALMLSDRGGTVRVFDTVAAACEQSRQFIDEQMPDLLKKIDGGKAGTVEFTDDMEKAVKGAWLVIEAVPEKLDLKKSLFGQLDKIADADTILASNSSSYACGDFIDEVEHPERVLNTHFYQPPKLNVVEMMSSGSTDPAIFELLTEVFPKHGLPTFLAMAKSTGFIFNRIWAAIKRECLRVVADGVSTPEDINEIWKVNFGMDWGPFELMDNVGLDVVRDIELHYMEEDPGLDDRPIRVLDEYINRGELGAKSGKGFLVGRDS